MDIVAPISVPPEATVSSAPLLTVVPLAVPPLSTTVPSALVPGNTSRAWPLETMMMPVIRPAYRWKARSCSTARAGGAGPIERMDRGGEFGPEPAVRSFLGDSVMFSVRCYPKFRELGGGISLYWRNSLGIYHSFNHLPSPHVQVDTG